jgi:hypothetical protein
MVSFFVKIITNTLLVLIPKLLEMWQKYWYQKKVIEQVKTNAEIKVEAYEKAPVDTAADDFAKLP